MLFEKEGIYTFDGKGELLITIMSSLAQEESRSISENITWGQRKSFSDGKVHLPYKRFLGYEKGEDGRPAVVESEARVVQLIYVQRLFIKAYNLMMQDRVQIIKQCEAWRARLMDFGTLDADIERQLEETQVVAELVKAAVKENASTAQSQEAYLKKYEALTERYEKAAAELERLQSLRTARSHQDKKMALYIRALKKQPEVMHDWNDTIWTVMIEKAIVHKDGKITFVFQNGTEIKTAL